MLFEGFSSCKNGKWWKRYGVCQIGEILL